MRYLLIILLLNFLNAELIKPENLDTLSTIHILFEWEQEPYAIDYNIQVSKTATFDNILIDTNSYNLIYKDKNNLEWNNEYHWRVRPIFLDESIGPWINQKSFSTSNPKFNEFGFINIDYEINNQHLIQDGINFFDDWRRKQGIAIDKDGYEVWNSNFGIIDINKYGYGFGKNYNNGLFSKFNFEKETLWQVPVLDIDPHEFKQAPNGNYIFFLKESQLGPIPIGDWSNSFQLLGYEADGITHEFEWLGYKIIELDKDTKEEVWSWNVFDYFSMNDFDSIGNTWWNAINIGYYDWTHVNALDFDQELNFIYVSNRHLSRITKIDYNSGEIVWNMGLSEDYNTGNNNICTDLGFSWQHHINILENGNLLFFDNGNLSNIIRGTNYQTSRILELEVSEDNFCHIVWEYDLPEHLFGGSWGSVQKLDNGNYLANTRSNDIGNIIEITEDKTIIWNATLNNNTYDPPGSNYRAFRVPSIYPDAFSVVINSLENINFSESISYPGIVVSENNVITIKIYNQSGYTQDYEYSFSDNISLFESTDEIISIESNESVTLTFEGDNINNYDFTEINFTVTPINHQNSEKHFHFYVSKSNDISISSFKILKNYPNPFNDHSKIIFDVPYQSEVEISIYNMKGQLLDILLNETKDEGRYIVEWNAQNYSSGVYFISMTSEDFIDTQKVTLIK